MILSWRWLAYKNPRKPYNQSPSDEDDIASEAWDNVSFALPVSAGHHKALEGTSTIGWNQSARHITAIRHLNQADTDSFVSQNTGAGWNVA